MAVLPESSERLLLDWWKRERRPPKA